MLTAPEQETGVPPLTVREMRSLMLPDSPEAEGKALGDAEDYEKIQSNYGLASVQEARDFVAWAVAKFRLAEDEVIHTFSVAPDDTQIISGAAHIGVKTTAEGGLGGGGVVSGGEEKGVGVLIGLKGVEDFVAVSALQFIQHDQTLTKISFGRGFYAYVRRG